MTTFNTGNKLGSMSPEDLLDNAQNFDNAVNDRQNSQWTDRLGNKRITWKGMEEMVNGAITNLGFNPVGSFKSGAVLYSPGDIIQDETSLIWYRWDGLTSLPKTVDGGSSPETTGGISKGAWQPVDITDLVRKYFDNKFEKLKSAQDWGRVGADTRTVNDKRILVQRDGTFDRLFIYLNHESNYYQQWEFTRGGGTGDGFDNNVPTHANGNMWFVSGVVNVMVGPVSAVSATDAAMTINGNHLVTAPDLRLNDGYAETTVFGKTIFVDYVARDDSGIANIYIDGNLHATLDQYNQSAGGVLTRTRVADGLSNASHTVRVEVSGNKNGSSRATIIRLRSINGVGLQDFDKISDFSVFDSPMKSGNSTYKIRNAAAELAIETTVNGNKVFSGAYHKYCYPRVANGQKLYIDGALVDFGSMSVGEIRVASDVRMLQDLILANVDTPVADVIMSHHFTSDGCNVKTNLTWTYPAIISRSYQAMWPSTADRAILGGMQKQYSAHRAGDYINVYQDAYNAMTYHSVDEWISGFYSNNEYGMRFENPDYIGLYIWDRSSDFKIYLRKFSGVATPGDKWNSDVTFFIGHCPETARVFDIDKVN